MAVSLRHHDNITQRLARRSLVLLPARVRGGWAACSALLIAVQLVAAAAVAWYWQERQASVQAQVQTHERSETAAQRKLGELQRELEQSRLQQRLSLSHSQELLGFLRQARVAKR